MIASEIPGKTKQHIYSMLGSVQISYFKKQIAENTK